MRIRGRRHVHAGVGPQPGGVGLEAVEFVLDAQRRPSRGSQGYAGRRGGDRARVLALLGSLEAPHATTFTVENSFGFVPDDASGPSYSGHSQTHISDRFIDVPGVLQFENTIIAKGDDGSVLRVHEVARALIAEDGTLTIVFDRARCESG